MDTITVTPATGTTITFQLAASPTVFTESSGDFQIYGISTTVGKVNLLFFSTYDYGGLGIETPQHESIVNGYGSQLFSGSNSAPTFVLGDFTLVDPFSGAIIDTVTIAPLAFAVVTPEPSSLILLGTGILGLLGVAQRRSHLN